MSERLLEVGDVVKITPKWLDVHEDPNFLYIVVEAFHDVDRYYITPAYSKMAIPPVNLVSGEMIMLAEVR